MIMESAQHSIHMPSSAHECFRLHFSTSAARLRHVYQSSNHIRCQHTQLVALRKEICILGTIHRTNGIRTAREHGVTCDTLIFQARRLPEPSDIDQRLIASFQQSMDTMRPRQAMDRRDGVTSDARDASECREREAVCMSFSFRTENDNRTGSGDD